MHKRAKERDDYDRKSKAFKHQTRKSWQQSDAQTKAEALVRKEKLRRPVERAQPVENVHRDDLTIQQLRERLPSEFRASIDTSAKRWVVTYRQIGMKPINGAWALHGGKNGAGLYVLRTAWGIAENLGWDPAPEKLFEDISS